MVSSSKNIHMIIYYKLMLLLVGCRVMMCSIGGEEIETSPVIQSFEAMTISDQPHVRKEKVVKESTPPTGTHDQFSPAAAPAAEEDRPQSTEGPKGPSYTEKLSATAAASEVRRRVGGGGGVHRVLEEHRVDRLREGGGGRDGREGKGAAEAKGDHWNGWR